jgi:hypothetical protein
LNARDDFYFLEDWKNALEHDLEWQENRFRNDRGVSNQKKQEILSLKDTHNRLFLAELKNYRISLHLPRFSQFEKKGTIYGLVSDQNGNERLQGFLELLPVPSEGLGPTDSFRSKIKISKMEVFYRNIGREADLPGAADLLFEYLLKHMKEDGMERSCFYYAGTDGSRSFAKRWKMVENKDRRDLSYERVAEEYEKRKLNRRFLHPLAFQEGPRRAPLPYQNILRALSKFSDDLRNEFYAQLRPLLHETYLEVSTELTTIGRPIALIEVHDAGLCKEVVSTLIKYLSEWSAIDWNYKNDLHHVAVLEAYEHLWFLDPTWQQFLPWTWRHPSLPKALLLRDADIHSAAFFGIFGNGYSEMLRAISADYHAHRNGLAPESHAA